MSTSLLYHAFGTQGYNYVSTRYEKGAVVFTVEQPDHSLCCSACGEKRVIRRGSTLRRFRAVPIGRKPVFVEMCVARLLCLACGLVRQVRVGFAELRRRHTRSFERYALQLSRLTTIQDAALHLGVSWDVVKDIQKRYLLRHFSKPRLKKLRRIAIDEISVGKGQKYLTVVLDLKSGVVVFVGDGKGSDALEPFWKRLKSDEPHFPEASPLLTRTVCRS